MKWLKTFTVYAKSQEVYNKSTYSKRLHYRCAHISFSGWEHKICRVTRNSVQGNQISCPVAIFCLFEGDIKSLSNNFSTCLENTFSDKDKIQGFWDKTWKLVIVTSFFAWIYSGNNHDIPKGCFINFPCILRI